MAQKLYKYNKYDLLNSYGFYLQTAWFGMEDGSELRLFLNQNFVEKLFHKKNLSGKTKKNKQKKIHGRRILSKAKTRN